MDFRRDYPNSRFLPEVDEALADCRDRLAQGDYEAGRFYQKQRRLLAAKIQFEHVVNNYPETIWACRSRLRLGEVYRTREKMEEARTWYQRTIDACPDGAEAGLTEPKVLGQAPDSGEEVSLRKLKKIMKKKGIFWTDF